MGDVRIAGVGGAQDEDILEERARSLARPSVAVAVPSVDDLELLVCAVGDERCALETAHVFYVGRTARLTAIASVPSPFVGITNHAGEILPVIDLGAVMGMPRARTRTTTLILGERRPEIALLVDAALDAVVVRRGSIASAAIVPEALAGILRGITDAGVSVLDVRTLLASPRLFVSSP